MEAGDVVLALYQNQFYVGVLFERRAHHWVVVFMDDGIVDTVHPGNIVPWANRNQDHRIVMNNIRNVDRGNFMLRMHTATERKAVALSIARTADRIKQKIPAVVHSPLSERALTAYRIFLITRDLNTPIYEQDRVRLALRELKENLAACNRREQEDAEYIDRLNDENYRLKAAKQEAMNALMNQSDSE